MTCKFSVDEEPKDHFIKKRFQRKIDLTYIVGFNCIDGVTIVGDRKMTVDNGADHFYDKKIFAPYANIIIGGSGTTGLIESFKTRLTRKTEELRSNGFPASMDVGIELKYQTEQVIREMAKEFHSSVLAEELQIMMAYRTTEVPELVVFNGYGLAEPVRSYRAIGHGEPYASVLLKTLWDNPLPLSMKQGARLGCLAIRYIQQMNLDNSVGLDQAEVSDHRFPNVWYMPIITNNSQEPEETLQRFPTRELSNSDVIELETGFTTYLQNLKNGILNINL